MEFLERSQKKFKVESLDELHEQPLKKYLPARISEGGPGMSFLKNSRRSFPNLSQETSSKRNISEGISVDMYFRRKRRNIQTSNPWMNFWRILQRNPWKNPGIPEESLDKLYEEPLKKFREEFLKEFLEWVSWGNPEWVFRGVPDAVPVKTLNLSQDTSLQHFQEKYIWRCFRRKRRNIHSNPRMNSWRNLWRFIQTNPWKNQWIV